MEQWQKWQACAAAAAVTLFLCGIVPIANRGAVCSDRIANQSIIHTHDATQQQKPHRYTQSNHNEASNARSCYQRRPGASTFYPYRQTHARASLQPEKSLLHASVPGAGEVSISQRTTRNNNLNHFLSFRVNINTVP